MRSCTRCTKILKGTRVVVTRPEAQSAALIARLEAEGAQPIAFPAIEISPMEHSRPTDFSPQLIVFISANAVAHGLPVLGKPMSAKIAAVGPATAEALCDKGIDPDVVPEPPYNSESLLEHSALHQINGHKVLIVRGVGGRETLREELIRRGAEVCYLECYRRVRPARDASAELLSGGNPGFDAWIATSAAALDNFIAMFRSEHRNSILRVPVVVVSDRMRRQAEASGFQKVIKADGASEDAIVRALTANIEGGNR